MQTLFLHDVPDVLRDKAVTAFEAGDVVGLLTTMNNLLGLRFVDENSLALKDRGIYEVALLVAYQMTRTNHHTWTLTQLDRLFLDCDRGTLRAAGDPLPCGERFTLYRGVAGKRHRRHVAGMSWTSSLETAAWFAGRLDLEDPAIYTTTVPAAEVYCYTHGRRENDFILKARNPRRIKVLQEMGLV